jgi:peptide/nickel transport system substrate-binding protein
MASQSSRDIDQNAQALRLESGRDDVAQTEVRSEDYLPLKRVADAGRLKLIDLGPGIECDALWFNLSAKKAKDPASAWLQRVEWRQAISRAIDRKAFADSVFLGAAVPVFGPIGPAFTQWYMPDLPHANYDPAEAKRLLGSIGLDDRDHDGVLEDSRGTPVRFALITVKGNVLERGAGVIRDDLRKVGIVVDVVPLETASLIQHLLSADYDALYFRLNFSDTDPALNSDFWLSSGSAHVWNIGQSQPATDWERRVDELMHEQAAVADLSKRKALFAQVQGIFAEQLPVIYFATPRLYIAMSSRVVNATPAPIPPQILWNPEILAVSRSAPGH